MIIVIALSSWKVKSVKGTGQRKAIEAEVYPLKAQVCEQVNHIYLLKPDQSSLVFYSCNRCSKSTTVDYHGAC
jgi:hypothetical protein